METAGRSWSLCYKELCANMVNKNTRAGLDLFRTFELPDKDPPLYSSLESRIVGKKITIFSEKILNRYKIYLSFKVCSEYVLFFHRIGSNVYFMSIFIKVP